MLTIAVLGAGSWGTALAKLFADRGHTVRLWARRDELAREITALGENRPYLPGHKLPATLHATSKLDQALSGAEAVYFVVPSHGLREIASQAALLLPPHGPLVSATKGIENESLLLMTQVLEEVLPPSVHARLCAVGGPSFAKEVAANMPAALCMASRNQEMAQLAQEQLAGDRMRVYTTEDVIGVEVGGALKNVIAIAAGAADGLGFGHNARAGLITRGLAEMARLATHLGANPLTLAGLAGLGDLVLTCTGDLSRNRSVGMELARGRSLDAVLGNMQMVAEGVRTAKRAYTLAQREGVDMPITTEVYRSLYEGKSPLDAVQSLLGRARRPERD